MSKIETIVDIIDNTPTPANHERVLSLGRVGVATSKLETRVCLYAEFELSLSGDRLKVGRIVYRTSNLH
jgi:hypothetical protein